MVGEAAGVRARWAELVGGGVIWSGRFACSVVGEGLGGPDVVVLGTSTPGGSRRVVTVVVVVVVGVVRVVRPSVLHLTPL